MVPNSKAYKSVKDLGVSVVSSLKFSQLYKNAAGKANRMLGFINKNISFKTKDVILLLYTSLVRPHLICCAVLDALLSKGYSETRGCPAKGYEDDYVLA